MTEASDFMVQLAAQRSKRLERALANRRQIHVQLVLLGAAHVTCTYNGYGDSGDIEGITVFKTFGEPGTPAGEELDGWKEHEVKLFVGGDDDPNAKEAMTLEKALEALFWDLLEATHPGFENNDGGQGEFEWDVATNELSLDHGDNYTETEHSAHEF